MYFGTVSADKEILDDREIDLPPHWRGGFAADEAVKQANHLSVDEKKAELEERADKLREQLGMGALHDDADTAT